MYKKKYNTVHSVQQYNRQCPAAQSICTQYVTATRVRRNVAKVVSTRLDKSLLEIGTLYQ